jgi:hypothetical protein
MGTVAKVAGAIGLLGAGTYFMMGGQTKTGASLARRASGGAPGTLGLEEEAKAPPQKKTLVRRHSSGEQFKLRYAFLPPSRV